MQAGRRVRSFAHRISAAGDLGNPARHRAGAGEDCALRFDERVIRGEELEAAAHADGDADHMSVCFHDKSFR